MTSSGISGPQKRPSMTPVETAKTQDIAGPAKTAGPAAAGKTETAGGLKDAFKPAAPGTSISSGLGGKGIICGGCWTPSPPKFDFPKIDLSKLDFKGAKLESEAKAAQGKADKFADDALKGDNKIDKKETRELKGLQRDANIAKTKVDLHDAQKAQKAALEEAKKAGYDQKSLDKVNQAGDKVNELQAKLQRQETVDKILDSRDKILDGRDNPPLGKKTPSEWETPGGCWPPFKPPILPGGVDIGICRPPRYELPDLPPGGCFPRTPDVKTFPCIDCTPFLTKSAKDMILY